jgi:hypothetical protein
VSGCHGLIHSWKRDQREVVFAGLVTTRIGLRREVGCK